MAGNSSIDTPRGFATDAFGQEQPGTGYGPGPSDAETTKLKRLEGFGDGKVGETGVVPSGLEQLIAHLDELRVQRRKIDEDMVRTVQLITNLQAEEANRRPLTEEQRFIRGTE